MLIPVRAWSAAWLYVTLGLTVLLLLWLALFQSDYGSVSLHGAAMALAGLLLIGHLAAFLLLGGVATSALIELVERHRTLGFVVATFAGGVACLPTFCGNNVLLQRFRWLLIGGAAVSAGVAVVVVWQLARRIRDGWQPRWSAPTLALLSSGALLVTVFGLKRLPLYPTAMLLLLFGLQTAVALLMMRLQHVQHGWLHRAPPALAMLQKLALLAVAACMLLGPTGITGKPWFTKSELALSYNIMGSKVLVQPRDALLHDAYKVAGVLGSGAPASKVVDVAAIVGDHKPAHRHDVILLVVDALRRDRMALHGGDIKMPHTEALARRAMVYSRAYSPADGTGLSMSSILSGVHPAVFSDLDAIPLFLPALLQHHGYETAAGGNELSLQFFVHKVLDGRVTADIGIEHSSFKPPDEQQIADAITRLGKGDGPKFEYIHLQGTHGPFRGPNGKADYARAVRAADVLVGRLMADIEDRAAWDRTILMLLADHGEGIGEHGIYGHSQALYEEQVGVPLIVAMPGVASGTNDVGTDLTLVPIWVMSGLGSRWPMPTSGGSPGVAGVTVQEHQIHGTTVWRSIRQGSWVYHHRYAAGVERLHDLVSDPGELTDVSASERERVVRFAELEKAHLDRVRQVVDAISALPLKTLPAPAPPPP